MFSGALLLAVVAWLFSAEPQPDPERVWHYVLFGVVLLAITGYLLGQIFDPGDASAYSAILVGVTLAFCAWFLGDTPYRMLADITWGYAAVCLVVPPAISWVVDRRRRKRDEAQQPGAPSRAQPPDAASVSGETAPASRDWGAWLVIPCLIVGLFICVAVIVKHWGLWAGLGAFILWPATLIAVPIYAAYADSDWWPLAIVYGGVAVGMLLRLLRKKRES